MLKVQEKKPSDIISHVSQKIFEHSVAIAQLKREGESSNAIEISRRKQQIKELLIEMYKKHKDDPRVIVMLRNYSIETGISRSKIKEIFEERWYKDKKSRSDFGPNDIVITHVYNIANKIDLDHVEHFIIMLSKLYTYFNDYREFIVYLEKMDLFGNCFGEDYSKAVIIYFDCLKISSEKLFLINMLDISRILSFVDKDARLSLYYEFVNRVADNPRYFEGHYPFDLIERIIMSLPERPVEARTDFANDILQLSMSVNLNNYKTAFELALKFSSDYNITSDIVYASILKIISSHYNISPEKSFNIVYNLLYLLRYFLDSRSFDKSYYINAIYYFGNNPKLVNHLDITPRMLAQELYQYSLSNDNASYSSNNAIQFVHDVRRVLHI